VEGIPETGRCVEQADPGRVRQLLPVGVERRPKDQKDEGGDSRDDCPSLTRKHT